MQPGSRGTAHIKKRHKRPASRRGSDMNYTLIMKTGESALVAIGPVAIEYQAAMLRDEIENSSDWTAVGIARVLTEAQARARMGEGTQ
jgi:hypothetical protein